MALVYNASSEPEAQKYERTAQMEPNPGVSALTVVNPGRAPGRNPFQWIEGRGQRHRHASPAYKGLRGALRWKGRAGHPRAKLYPVDELGTIVSRSVSKRLMTTNRRKKKMGYSVRSLRRSVRKNRHSAETQSILAAARAIDAGRSPSGVRRKKRKSKVVQRKSKSHATTRVAGHRKSRKRSLAAKRAWRKRKSGKAAHRKTARKSARKSHKRKSARKSHRRSSKRSAAAKKGWRSRRARRGAARRSRRRKGYGGHRFSTKGIRKRYHSRGKIPAVRRVSRLFNRPDVTTIKKGVRGSSRMAANRRRRRTHRNPGVRYVMTNRRRSRRRRTRRNPFYVTANRRRSRRRRTRRNPFYVTANRRRSRRRRSRRMHSNRRMSKRRRSLAAKKGWRSRRARRGSKRRRTRRNPFYVTANRRRSRRRRSMRRNSRFRPFKRVNSNRRRSRRRSMRRNMLAQSVHGRGGRMMQVVELGPRSRSRRGRRMSGYPVFIPAHVSKHAYVRRFTFGGAAKDAHRRSSSSTRERKKYPRRRVHQNRRRSMRRNPRYVFANRRHSRRHRGRRMFRNMAADVMKDVLVPVAGGTAGFVTARVLSNAVAQVGAITNILDKGQPPEMADNTKIVANLLGIAATLGAATKVDVIKKNQGAIVTGMGLALVDRLIGKFVSGAAGNYLSGMRGIGEYFEQPVAGLGAYVSDPTAGMGEYFEQPVAGLGAMYATAGVGEYFEQPVAGLGAMYATAGTDGLMDVAEAAAGVDQAAAGLGLQYATAGLGQAHTPPVHDIGFQSIETPTDVAAPVTTDLPYTRRVPTSLVGGEARGYAGGIFAGTVFSGS